MGTKITTTSLITNTGYEVDRKSKQFRKKKIKVSDFTFCKVIGEGKFSKVLLVRKKSNMKYYAMKIMSKQHLIEEDIVLNVKTERQILELFNHPFLINLHYAFQDVENLYIVVNFCHGGEIFNHMRAETIFKENRVKLYAAEIFVALQFLHSQNVIYRDLKPENVLLTKTGHVVLTDFGLSKKLMKNEKRTRTLCGSIEYLAPELVLNQKYGFSCDWWALGVLVYEMLFGRSPFYHHEESKTFDMIVHDDVEFPNIPLSGDSKERINVSKNAKDFIIRLLNKDPQKRLGSKQDAKDVKNHKWFSDINWVELIKLKVKPQFVPKIDKEDDIKYIDKSFLKIPLPKTDPIPCQRSPRKEPTLDMVGFSYSNSYSSMGSNSVGTSDSYGSSNSPYSPKKLFHGSPDKSESQDSLSILLDKFEDDL